MGEIIEGRDIKAAVRESVDVCIIGSGAGGAVMAKELAEAGAKVVVLEEGGYYTRRDFNISIKDAFAKFYRNLGMDTAIGVPSIIIPTGKCLGGTTLVNMGTCFRAPARILDEWQEMGIEGYSENDLAPYYDKVEKLLNVQPVKDQVMGRGGEVIAEGARKLGLRPEPISRNVSDACKGCGNCSYGCAEDAKQAMHLNYIPWAVEAGARFYCDTRAEGFLHDEQRISGVYGSVREREDGSFRNHVDISAEVVVLAAGALHSSALLLQNKIANRSGQVGKNLKVHLCARAIGVFDQTIDSHQGVCQNLYIADYIEQGIMLEATFTGPASELPGLAGFDRELWSLAKQYRNMASIGIMISDTSYGRVRADRHGNPLISYDTNQEDSNTLKKAALISARILFAAGAKKVYFTCSAMPVINSVAEVETYQDVRIKPGDWLLMAFHPMCTTRMGVHRKSSVVDNHMESHDLRNLFITDAGVFPTSLGVNPQETIWAMATKCAEYISRNVL
jgi:choline dehydrogenase-like flavoprotein